MPFEQTWENLELSHNLVELICAKRRRFGLTAIERINPESSVTFMTSQ